MGKAFTDFLEIHAKGRLHDSQRLGQRFHNMYLKEPVLAGGGRDLFYLPDADATTVIYHWLHDHQYVDELPPVLTRT